MLKPTKSFSDEMALKSFRLKRRDRDSYGVHAAHGDGLS